MVFFAQVNAKMPATTGVQELVKRVTLQMELSVLIVLNSAEIEHSSTFNEVIRPFVLQ